MIDGFAYADDVLRYARWDAKYATWDNFTGSPVDGYEANRVVATTELLSALLAAESLAHQQGYGLLLWDAYRPQRAVARFARWSAEEEEDAARRDFHPNITKPEMIERGYVSLRSGHTRGSAVDLTLFDLGTQRLLDMGGRHDLMDQLSHHDAQGIPDAVARNRSLLKSIMCANGFDPLENEWWHYSLTEEPHPDSYFDFAIRSRASEAHPRAGTAPANVSIVPPAAYPRRVDSTST